ncbi:flagellar hook-associated protein FlgK [Metabacillus idriensis]|uniref:flagellar hook-associated protein FlgK n=1 Tax=Metabacillus idriensis TaxID=324768 RepID=UPI00174A268A|nr:flagellar hook-associated protein FlgK [Metabacillus idriensis]
MRSTFSGLEIAKRGMFTQQSALNTTGHNISNANTPGYTRQRVNFVQTEPFPYASKNRPDYPGQTGTGVEAGIIQRVRDSFLDTQFRYENNKVGYWDSRADALLKMEEIMNEPSETGLAKTFDRFWQSMQDLALNPENAGARAVVRERGVAVAETFQYLSTSLKAVQGDLKSELDASMKEINSLAKQINGINKQISEIEPHGYLANDLYDERDRLLDQLSGLANIKISTEKSGGNSLAVAEGSVTVEMMDDNGKSLGTLVDGKNKTTNEISIKTSSVNGLVETVSIGSKEMNVRDFGSAGEIRSLIDSYGSTYTVGSETFEEGLYPDMLAQLDQLAYSFATAVNQVQSEGYSIKQIKDGTGSTPFFEIGSTPKGAASSIKIHQSIIDSTDHIAASKTGNIGDGENAVALGEVKNKTLSINGKTTTIQDFYESLIGGMAVNAQESNRLTGNSDVLRSAVDERRQSVSAVSLDEEMTNMIQFQHAYNASAKMISLTDEMLDTIINGLGR